MQVGFGLLGEQGAESIHAKFNSLLSEYNTMHDKVQRLLCIVKQHFLTPIPPHLTYRHQKRESSSTRTRLHGNEYTSVKMPLFGDAQLPQNYRSRFQKTRKGYFKDLTLLGKSAFGPFLRNILHLLRHISFKRSAFESHSSM